MAAAGLLGHSGGRVGVVDVGAAGRRVRPRLAAARARWCARPRHLGGARHADLRRPAVAAGDGSRPRGRAGDRGAPSLGLAPGGRHHAPAVPPLRGARHPGDRRALRDHPAVIGFQVDNEPGSFRSTTSGVSTGSCAAEAAVRRCRDAQPRVGAHLLVASDRGWTSSGCRMATTAAVRPRVAPLPGRAHHRLHRVAGSHRARVLERRPVRDDLHLVPAPASRRRGARQALDVTAANPYYVMQEHSRLDSRSASRQVVDDRRVGTLRAGRPRVPRSSSGILVTETNAQSIGGRRADHTPATRTDASWPRSPSWPAAPR